MESRVKEYPAIEDIVAIPRYPWSGMVDLAFTITGDNGVKYDTAFTAKDLVGGTNLVMKTIAFSGEVSLQTKNDSPLFSLHPGSYHAIWNAAADLPSNFVAERVTVVGDVKVPGYPVVQNGLLAWFPFNGDVKDYSGNGYHLSGNVASWVSDRNSIGKMAASFTGASTLSQTKSFNHAGSLTIACWAKPSGTDNYPEGSYGDLSNSMGFGNFGMDWYTWPLIISPVTGTSNSNVGTGFSVGKNRIIVLARTDKYYGVILNYKGNFGSSWHNFVVVCAQGGAPKLYVDGAVVNASSLSVGKYLMNQTAKIGGGVGHVTMNYSGCLDDLCIYSRALSAAEVKQLYQAK